MIEKIKQILILAAICLLLSGCVFENPLSSEGPLPVGSPLIGTWKLVKSGEAKKNGETVFWHIGNDKEGHAAKLNTIEFRGDRMISETGTAISTELNGNTYLNVQYQDKKGHSLGYMLFKYMIDQNGRLTLIWPNGQFLKNALWGEVLHERKKTDRVPEGHNGVEMDLVISDDQQTLRNFISDSDASLFTDVLFVFERLESH